MMCAKKLMRSIDLENPEIVFCERCNKGPCVQDNWYSKLTAECQRLGRDLTLDELLALAKAHDMTPEEIAEQRKSWANQDMD